MTNVKKTKRVLGAKKEVTEKDAAKAAPLVGYWAKRLKEAKYSDNWPVFFFGVEFGVFLCAWVFVIAVLLSV